MKKEFVRYVFPSMISFVFCGLYAMVDAFFVGRNVGDAGLAAINIAYPLVALLQAVGTGIGIGGSVYMSTCMGTEDKRGEKSYFVHTLLFLAFASVLLVAVILPFASPLLGVLGAHGEVHAGAKTYLTYMIAGAACQVFSTGLVPVLRNYGKAFLAMGAMIAGFVANIVLDWLFVQVFDWGLTGAAVASVIGQAVTVVPCALFLLLRKREKTPFRFSFAIFGRIAKVGLSPFGVTMCPNIGVAVMNRLAYDYGGDPAVAAYAVIAYVYFALLLIMQGIGDGAQPLISRYYGAGERAKYKKIVAYAFVTSFISFAVFFALLLLGRKAIPAWFGAGEQAAALAEKALPIFGVGVLFAAFNRVCAAYFYSVKSNLFAYILVYGEVAALVLFAVTLPIALGVDGLWWANPVSQAAAALAGALLLFIGRKKRRVSEPLAKTEEENADTY